LTKGQAAILTLIKAMKDNAGNVPSMAAIYPDGSASGLIGVLDDLARDGHR
jgi:hypothetical protein